MIYIQVFISFLKIGLFGFGGGYSIISLIQYEMLKNQWLSQSELTDIIAISQTTPGPIAINCATYVGYIATGNIFGAAIATFAVILPSIILMIIICKFTIWLSGNRYIENCLFWLRPTVLGFIAAAILFLFNGENFIDYKSFIIFIISLLLMFIPKMNPIFIIVFAGLAGLLIY